jgi:hypothetical protein
VAKISVASVPHAFKGKVKVPHPDGALELQLVFKHRTRKQLEAWCAETERSDIDTVLSCVEGWENVEEPFERGVVEKFLDDYHAAGGAIVDAYIDQLVRGRRGN